MQALMRFEGGEEAGLERLRHYLWETLVWDTGAASTYFDTRNGAASWSLQLLCMPRSAVLTGAAVVLQSDISWSTKFTGHFM